MAKILLVLCLLLFGCSGKDGGPGPKGDTGTSGIDGTDGVGIPGTNGRDGIDGTTTIVTVIQRELNLSYSTSISCAGYNCTGTLKVMNLSPFNIKYIKVKHTPSSSGFRSVLPVDGTYIDFNRTRQTMDITILNHPYMQQYDELVFTLDFYGEGFGSLDIVGTYLETVPL